MRYTQFFQGKIFYNLKFQLRKMNIFILMVIFNLAYLKFSLYKYKYLPFKARDS